MRKISMTALAASMLALAACGGGADDRAAENIEAAGDNIADNLEAMADNTSNEVVSDRLEDRADNVREAAEEKAEQVDRTDNSAAATPAINGM
jgi:hypothetical protein